MKYLSLILSLMLISTACAQSGKEDGTTTASTATAVERQPFNTDSAMSYLKAQTDFGPRVPGTEAHRLCGDYLVATLERLGADTVFTQEVEVTAWNSDKLPLRNIIARFNSNKGSNPILLASHWDSRPWADNDPDSKHAQHPIDGANDGASGVAVLLELARLNSVNGGKLPLEILLVDGEDYGMSEDMITPDKTPEHDSSWCLGTQKWIESNPYTDATRPRYGILLDMVGGKDALFHRELISQAYAPRIVDMVWTKASQMGLGDRFINSSGGAVLDDHVYLNQAHIPTIDIIESINPSTGSFNPTWHTVNDTYENIDPNTINAVGTLMTAITEL